MSQKQQNCQSNWFVINWNVWVIDSWWVIERKMWKNRERIDFFFVREWNPSRWLTTNACAKRKHKSHLERAWYIVCRRIVELWSANYSLHIQVIGCRHARAHTHHFCKRQIRHFRQRARGWVCLYVSVVVVVAVVPDEIGCTVMCRQCACAICINFPRKWYISRNMTSSPIFIYMSASMMSLIWRWSDSGHTHIPTHVPLVLLLNFIYPSDYERLIRLTRLLYKHENAEERWRSSSS